VLQQQADHLHLTVLGCTMERGELAGLAGVHLGAARQQDFGDLDMPPGDR
jgi:hypothetical protein